MACAKCAVSLRDFGFSIMLHLMHRKIKRVLEKHTSRSRLCKCLEFSLFHYMSRTLQSCKCLHSFRKMIFSLASKAPCSSLPRSCTHPILLSSPYLICDCFTPVFVNPLCSFVPLSLSSFPSFVHISRRVQVALELFLRFSLCL